MEAAKVRKKRTVVVRADREKKRQIAERAVKANAVMGTKLEENSDAAVSLAPSMHSVEAGTAETADRAVTEEKMKRVSAGLETKNHAVAVNLATQERRSRKRSVKEIGPAKVKLKSQIELKDREGNMASFISTGSGNAGPTPGLVMIENRKDAAKRNKAD